MKETRLIKLTLASKDKYNTYHQNFEVDAFGEIDKIKQVLFDNFMKLYGQMNPALCPVTTSPDNQTEYVKLGPDWIDNQFKSLAYQQGGEVPIIDRSKVNDPTYAKQVKDYIKHLQAKGNTHGVFKVITEDGGLLEMTLRLTLAEFFLLTPPTKEKAS